MSAAPSQPFNCNGQLVGSHAEPIVTIKGMLLEAVRVLGYPIAISMTQIPGLIDLVPNLLLGTRQQRGMEETYVGMTYAKLLTDSRIFYREVAPKAHQLVSPHIVLGLHWDLQNSMKF